MKLSRYQLRRLIMEEAKAVTATRPAAKEIEAAFKSLSSSSEAWQNAASKVSKEVAGPEAAMASILSELKALWEGHHMPNTSGATTRKSVSSIIDKITEELERLSPEDEGSAMAMP